MITPITLTTQKNPFYGEYLDFKIEDCYFRHNNACRFFSVFIFGYLYVNILVLIALLLSPYFGAFLIFVIKYFLFEFFIIKKMNCFCLITRKWNISCTT